MSKKDNWLFGAWLEPNGAYSVKTFLGNPVDESLATFIRLKEDTRLTGLTKQAAEKLAEIVNNNIMERNKK